MISKRYPYDPLESLKLVANSQPFDYKKLLVEGLAPYLPKNQFVTLENI